LISATCFIKLANQQGGEL